MFFFGFHMHHSTWPGRMLRMEAAQACKGLSTKALFHVWGKSSNLRAEALAHCASNPFGFLLAAHWPAGLINKNIKYRVCGQVQTKLTRNICCCQICLPAPRPSMLASVAGRLFLEVVALPVFEHSLPALKGRRWRGSGNNSG